MDTPHGARTLTTVRRVTTRLPSLDLVLAEARAERDTQIRHFESLDSKSGIVMGFAGVLVAVGESGSALTAAGRSLSAVSAILALWAFLPRGFPVLDLRRLRDLYAQAQTEFTRQHLLDAHVDMVVEASALLQRKALRLKWAAAFLGTSVVALVPAILSVARIR